MKLRARAIGSKRSRPIQRRATRTVAAVGVVAGATLGLAPPASATLDGPCTANWSFAQGTSDTPAGTVYDATSDQVMVVRLKDQVSWKGAVNGVSGRREISGHVTVDLPWPWGEVTVKSWGGDGKTASATSNQGVENYDLPGLIPRKVEFKVNGVHNDVNGVTCTGSVRVKVDGSPFSSPLAPIALAGTAGSLALLALAGRPKFTQVWIEHP